MKFSWTHLKISIAGAKLSHLVQKDRIWDHGSMAEQARIIFYQVQRAMTTGHLETLKRHCSFSCLEKIHAAMRTDNKQKSMMLMNASIREIAIVDVQPGKKQRPDRFSALIKGFFKDIPAEEFKAHCSFVRQGDWWMLSSIKYQFLKMP